MCEITSDNFKNKLQDIENHVNSAKFIAIDLEFSGLQTLNSPAPSLFDSLVERYRLLKKNIQYVIPLQVGITTFHFDPKTCDYYGHVYSFYVIPAKCGNLDKSFVFQTSSVNFLCMHNFDFNKFAYTGIPYVNRLEEEQLRQSLENGTLFKDNYKVSHEFNDAINMFTAPVESWYRKAKDDDFLEIPEIMNRFKKMHEVIYLLHNHFRKTYKNLWTYVHLDCFMLKKLSPESFSEHMKRFNLERDYVDEIIGFRKVFSLLVSAKKPIVGHNILTDLMILYNCFEAPLPESYYTFKKAIHDLLPTIFDTKSLYYELRDKLPKIKDIDNSGLESLFNYFKDGYGRSLSTAAVTSDIPEDQLYQYHQAGWDSFCAGYIFLRMGLFKLTQVYPKRIDFVFAEVLGSLIDYKNIINVIKGVTNNMILDGDDPNNIRPAWLVLETRDKRQIDIFEVSKFLKSLGSIDMKFFSGDHTKIILAVDTERTVQEIFKLCRQSSLYRVRKYNVLLHSKHLKYVIVGAAFTILIGGIIMHSDILDS